LHRSSLLKFGASIEHEVQIIITNLTVSFGYRRKVFFFFGYRRKVAKQSDELDEAVGTTDNLDDAFSSYKQPWMRPTNLESSFVQPSNV